MELKNKIDWQVKGIQECGLSIQATGRNEFHVIAADVTNFAYYWTKKEPKTFENTNKTGKKYFVLAWKFDNVSKWVSIPTFKKIVVEDWYLISLDRKFTNVELIKELDQAAAGYDDVEPFVMKDDIYIKSVSKHNRDITKLSDAIVKNNTDLIEEEKEKIITETKAKRLADKKAHVEKMKKLQENIKNIRKEELIKKISDLQSSLAIEPLNGKEIVNHLETEDNLTITEIECYIDRIIDQHFEKRFLTDTFLIYLIKGISLIAKTQTLTLNERNIKIDNYLLDKYNKTISDWSKFANDDAMDEEDIEIAANENKARELDEKYAPKQGEDVSDDKVKRLIAKVYYVDKKVKLNEVIELLNDDGLTNQDIIKTLNYVKTTKTDEEEKTLYKSANVLASVINLVHQINFEK